MENTGLLRQFKATKKDQHSRIVYTCDKNQLKSTHTGNKRGKSRKKPLTKKSKHIPEPAADSEGRSEVFKLIAVNPLSKYQREQWKYPRAASVQKF